MMLIKNTRRYSKDSFANGNSIIFLPEQKASCRQLVNMLRMLAVYFPVWVFSCLNKCHVSNLTNNFCRKVRPNFHELFAPCFDSQHLFGQTYMYYQCSINKVLPDAVSVPFEKFVGTSFQLLLRKSRDHHDGSGK